MFSPGLDSLQAAYKRGSLTLVGSNVLEQMQKMYAMSEGNWKILSELGIAEQRGIAERMVDNYRDVFKRRRGIEAFSGLKKRCKSSMDAFVKAVKECSPKLRISKESGEQSNSILINEDYLPEARLWYNPRIDSMIVAARDWRDCVNELYTDSSSDEMESMLIARSIWQCWADAPCTGMDEFDIREWLNEDELRDMARWQDMHICMKCLRTDHFGEARVASQYPLLEDVITRADNALLNGNTAATLRFGHDSNLAPLMALMNIEGFESVYVLGDRPDPRWNSAKLMPMASNIQLVFYSHPEKQDVLVKILFNEKEVRVCGLDSVQGPFYSWNTLKRFWR